MECRYYSCLLYTSSALLVSREVKRWNAASVISLLVGAVLAYWITVISPVETPNTWWFILLSGAVAICAMILPGISGAFILLLLGKYQFILLAVGELRIGVLALFVIGAVAGIVSFSHPVSYTHLLPLACHALQVGGIVFVSFAVLVRTLDHAARGGVVPGNGDAHGRAVGQCDLSLYESFAESGAVSYTHLL